MRVALDCLVRFVLAPLLLIACLAPLAQAQKLVVTSVEPAAVLGPIEIARASTEAAGTDNLQYVHLNQPGVDTATFFWDPQGPAPIWTWTYNGEVLSFDVNGTSVSRFSQDRIGVLFIECTATAPSSSIDLTWNFDESATPGLVPGGPNSGSLSVDASGETTQAALRFSGPVFTSFVLSGTIDKDFAEPPPASLLSCSFITSAKLINDRDGDGVPNDQDICPDTFDPDQVDSEKDVGPDGVPGVPGDERLCPEDEFGRPQPVPGSDDICGDGIGDKCDICRTTVDRGLLDDFDNDGVPDPCDNCSRAFCVERGLPAFICYNPDQVDLEFDVGPDGVPGVPGVDERLCPPDPLDLLRRPAPVPGSDDICGDGIGGKGITAEENEFPGCDNCPNNFNPGQEDDNNDGFGNVCAPVGFVSEFGLAEPEPPGAQTVSLLSSVAALPGETLNLIGNGSSRISIECGQFSVVELTIGVSAPSTANLTFGGCDPATGSCSGAPVCANLGDPGCLQPVVDPDESFTLGPGLMTPGVPSNALYLHLEAGPEVPADPLARERLCQPNEQVELGFLDVSGLDADEIISLTTAGVQALGFEPIVNADPAEPVEASQTTTTDLAETETIELTISPSINDATGLTETQLTLFSDLRITNVCFGLQAPTQVAFNAVKVGDCTQNHPVSDGTNTLDVQLCQAGETPPGRGPGVLDGETDATPRSYVVRPNEPTAGFLDLPADTTYYVMQGALPQFVPGSGLDETVNNPGQNSLLGTHRYEDQPREPPVVIFEGCQAILDFVGDGDAPNIINVFPGGGSVALAEISRVGTFDPAGDLDDDGVANDDDNCVNAANADQLDQGQPALNVVDARQFDGAGDICQCGDGQVAAVSEPGSVLLQDSNNESDLEECRRAAGNDPTLDPGAQVRCSVAGGFEVSAADLLLLSLALDQDDTEVTPADIEQVCQPALVPEE